MLVRPSATGKAYALILSPELALSALKRADLPQDLCDRFAD